jgi:hypothetical protein
MLLGHHSGEVEPRGLSVGGCRGEGRGMPSDLHVGWELVHHDWGVRQRESPGHSACPVVRVLDAMRGLARRLAQIVLRASGALACARSSHD